MTTSALKRRSFLQGSLLAAAVIGSTPAVAAELHNNLHSKAALS